MDKLPIVETAEINNYIVSSDNYDNVFSITEIDAGLSPIEHAAHGGYTSPVRLNTLLIVLVLQGSSQISLDYVPYTLTANCFLIIMPTHIIQMAKSSPDFKSLLMLVDKSFLDECNPAKRSPSMANYMELRNNPCTELLPHEASHINNCLQLLRSKIQLRNHSFHKEVMQNAFVGFLLEMANVLIGKNDSFIRPTPSRKEDLMNQFMQLLIIYAKEHHDVGFYAEKLFITPQYLSLILKEQTGRSANKWIDDALITEAKILLRGPQITVQQVADQLNFSDQSTFGKFFKKHIGLSPMEYRKKMY